MLEGRVLCWQVNHKSNRNVVLRLSSFSFLRVNCHLSYLHPTFIKPAVLPVSVEQLGGRGGGGGGGGRGGNRAFVTLKNSRWNIINSNVRERQHVSFLLRRGVVGFVACLFFEVTCLFAVALLPER